mgnify:CR=1 FL=1
MAKIRRGFLMLRNMKTGDTRPFFIKVREEDIIWKDQAATRDDIVETKMTKGWFCETHSLLKRICLRRRLALPTLTFVNTRKATCTITLPKKINASTSVLHVIKESGGNNVLENAMIEGAMVNADADGLSTTMEITLASPDGEFQKTNITGLVCYANIVIDGYYE